MKRVTLRNHTITPRARHIELAEQYGGDSLDEKPPGEFFNGAPEPLCYARAENGCLIKMTGCVFAHTDHWLGSFLAGPRGQRSLSWVLRGEVEFKVDGSPHVRMSDGDFVVFDHRREHMVLANDYWLGAAWQLAPVKIAGAGPQLTERA